MKTILMMALTADGKIAKDENHLADWTSGADKKMFVEETKKSGVIIMGKKTYDTIGRPLPNRLNIVITRTPDISLNIENKLIYTNDTPSKILKKLENKNYKSVILGGGASINGLFLKENLIDEIW